GPTNDSARDEPRAPTPRSEEGHMPNKDRETTSTDRQNEYMRGGKGRKDEVGKSGIYPASSPDAPANAEVRSEGELVSHKGPQKTPTTEQASQKPEQSTGSEYAKARRRAAGRLART